MGSHLKIDQVEEPVHGNPSHACVDKPSRVRVRNFARTDLGMEGERLGLGFDRSFEDIAEQTYPSCVHRLPASQALREGDCGLVTI